MAQEARGEAQAEDPEKVYEQFSLVVGKATKLRDTAKEVNAKTIATRERLQRKQQEVEMLKERLTSLEQQTKTIGQQMGRMTNAASE